MRKLTLDLDQIVVHTFATRDASSITGPVTLSEAVDSGAYRSLDDLFLALGPAPTPNGVTCD